ncbi:MAG: GDSL-type esterase/lipase family protein [Candidatus Aenigmatarchaeota archaeon]
MTDVEILAFGDSVTFGAWDKEGGWIQRLRRFLEEKNSPTSANFYYPIYNLGVDGDTTKSLSERFDTETKQRLAGTELKIIIQIGMNDCSLVNNKIRIPIGIFEENIKRLFLSAKKYTSQILFVGYNPVDETKSQPVWWNDKLSFKNEHIMEYEKSLRELCNSEGIQFVEIFDNWIKLDYKKLLDDGIHPNSEGHQKIFEAIRDFLI